MLDGALQEKRDFNALANVSPGTWIEIEHDGSRNCGIRRTVQRRMQFQRGRIRRPRKSSRVLDQDIVGVRTARMPRDGKCLDPLRSEVWVFTEVADSPATLNVRHQNVRRWPLQDGQDINPAVKAIAYADRKGDLAANAGEWDRERPPALHTICS